VKILQQYCFVVDVPCLCRCVITVAACGARPGRLLGQTAACVLCLQQMQLSHPAAACRDVSLRLSYAVAVESCLDFYMTSGAACGRGLWTDSEVTVALQRVAAPLVI